MALQDQPLAESSARGASVHDAAELLAQSRTALQEAPATDESLESVQDPDPILDDDQPETESLEDEADGQLEEADEDTEDEPESDADQPDEESEDADNVITLDGEEFTVDQVKEWREAGLRTADYQRKTQVLSQQRQAIDAQTKELNSFAAVAERVMQNQLERVASKVKGFEGVDWAKLAKESPTEYNAKKAERDVAYSEYQDRVDEIQQFRQQYEQAQEHDLRLRAQAALPELKSRVSGWSDGRYSDLRTFLVDDFGAPAEQVNRITDPWFWHVVNEAMTLSRAKSIAGKKQTPKRSPSRTLKAKNATQGRAVNKQTDKKALDAIKNAPSTWHQMDAAVKLMQQRRVSRGG